jgi:hypothetical protein
METKEIFDVSVILPISSSAHPFFDDLLERSIKSLQMQLTGINELVIVHTDDEKLKNKLTSYDFGDLNVNLIENKGDFDFATQVNLGVKNAKSKWVSILEFDDDNIKFPDISFNAEIEYSALSNLLSKLDALEIKIFIKPLWIDALSLNEDADTDKLTLLISNEVNCEV